MLNFTGSINFQIWDKKNSVVKMCVGKWVYYIINYGLQSYQFFMDDVLKYAVVYLSV